ncbi:bifunctional methylenetetrahydrofolate dehydrogenase/methenyltetrahydrofolate cyclohydrolase, partial [Clostridium perfringens]|nr:bifunctional methylenetetrahydrofolate dehydrogenase/methenyltetrahydrofolate cyclohydrolase [Clostridium perfringens]
MGQIINGREIANNIKEEIKEYILKRKEIGLRAPKIV